MTAPIGATVPASRHPDYRSDDFLGTSWRFGRRSSAQAAKAAAGRAHRAVSDAALQGCGAIGLTAEHDLNRYVAGRLPVDALCGSHLQLESLPDERLVEMRPPARRLPAIFACS